MPKVIPNPGTYNARLTSNIVVYETDQGALCAALALTLLNSDVAWSGKTTLTIGKSDGTIQKRTVETLKQVFGWDGVDFDALTTTDYTGVEFEVVGEHEQFTPRDGGEERTVFKIQWVNPPGGHANMPEAIDKKTFTTKWGAKLKALGGGVAQKPATTSKPAGNPTPSSGPTSTSKSAGPATGGPPPAKKNGPPVRTAVAGQKPTATMEEAWNALCASRPDLNNDQAQLGDVWYQEIEAMFPGKTNADLSIQDWGALKAKFDAQAPA